MLLFCVGDLSPKCLRLKFAIDRLLSLLPANLQHVEVSYIPGKAFEIHDGMVWASPQGGLCDEMCGVI